MKEFLPTGEIVNTHGIRGEVRILPWADSPDFLLNFKELYLDGEKRKVQSSRVQKTCVLVKFKDIDTVEEAALLRGKQVQILKSDARLDKGTFFVADLVGLTVIDQNGTEIGKLTEVLSMPKNDVYIVTGQGEYMIPAVKEYVKDIDLKKGTMQVLTIEGMKTDAD